VDDDGDYEPFILKLFKQGELLESCDSLQGSGGSATSQTLTMTTASTSATTSSTGFTDTGISITLSDTGDGYYRGCFSGGSCYRMQWQVDSVDDTNDANPGDTQCADSNGNCSLRAAIEEANYCSGPNTIVLPSGNYVLSLGSLEVKEDLKIVGEGAATTIIDGNNSSRVFMVYEPFELSGVTVTGGNASCGGGIEAWDYINIRDSVIRNNTAYRGGGLCGGYGAIINTTISDNTATNYGGGVISWENLEIADSTITRNTAGKDGGGIYSSSYNLTITNSTISNNSASRDGGGIYSYVITATNCTISGNTATGKGGGFFSALSRPIDSSILTNVTITDNSASSGGGIYRGGFYYPTLINTIVANQKSGGDCSDVVIDQGGNLDSDGTCGVGLTANPLLGPLQDNGGPTLTHALQSGSPAIDAGDNANCPETDQRGVPRSDGACDIGAYEYP